MTPYTEHLGDADISHVRALIGHKLTWIFAPRLLFAEGSFITTQLLFSLGPPKKRDLISVQSTRFETPVEYIDFYRFTVEPLREGEGDVPYPLILLGNISAITVEPSAPVENVEIRKATYEGDYESVSYDSEIVLRMSNGRSIVVGHPPPVYVGVSLRITD
jgi:hypothetical protein